MVTVEEFLISSILSVIQRYVSVPAYVEEVIQSMDRLSAIGMYRHTVVIKETLDTLDRDDEPVFVVDEDIEIEIKTVEDQITKRLGARDYRLITTPLPQTLPDKIDLMESEAELREKGYDDDWIAGLDITKESLQFAESLRTRALNKPSFAYTEHIPEFAQQIDAYIAFIEAGIRRQDSSDTAIRLAQLETFKVEAKNRQQLEMVTYRWFLGWVYRLVIVATPVEKRRFGDYRMLLKADDPWTTHDDLEVVFNRTSPTEDERLSRGDSLGVLLNQFPNIILIPTLSNLGMMSVSRTFQTRIQLLQLMNIDNPQDHFEHDVHHTIERFEKGITEDTVLFDRAFLYKLRSLPVSQRDQRKWIEYIYYYMNHEDPHLYPFDHIYSLGNDFGISEERESGTWFEEILSLNLVDRNDPNSEQIFDRLIRRAWNDFRQISSEITSEMP